MVDPIFFPLIPPTTPALHPLPAPNIPPALHIPPAPPEIPAAPPNRFFKYAPIILAGTVATAGIIAGKTTLIKTVAAGIIGTALGLGAGVAIVNGPTAKIGEVMRTLATEVPLTREVILGALLARTGGAIAGVAGTAILGVVGIAISAAGARAGSATTTTVVAVAGATAAGTIGALAGTAIAGAIGIAAGAIGAIGAIRR